MEFKEGKKVVVVYHGHGFREAQIETIEKIDKKTGTITVSNFNSKFNKSGGVIDNQFPHIGRHEITPIEVE